MDGKSDIVVDVEVTEFRESPSAGGFGEEIEISQGAELNRPSKLHARVEGSPDRIERVEVGGSAITVARGEFQL